MSFPPDSPAPPDHDRDDGRDRERPARPPDPAGTQPRYDPERLLPSRPLRPREHTAVAGDVIEGHAVEDGQELPPADHREGDLLPERRAAGGVGAVRAPKVATPHAPRFHFLYGALVALAVAVLAAGAIALLAGRADDDATQARGAWSAWHPTAGALSGAGQIAGHVGREYRLGGRQLVNVRVSPLAIEGIPLSVAIRRTPAQGGDIKVFDDDGLIYRLCGLGPDCAIDQGKASPARHLLLRREALELALYSFRYLDGVDQVVVFMPPKKGDKPSQAVFFRRGDVAPQLERPLQASLSPRTPSVASIAAAGDRPLVDRLTLGMDHLFTFSLTQANTENRGFLVLDPLPPTTTNGTTETTETGGSSPTPSSTTSKQKAAGE